MPNNFKRSWTPDDIAKLREMAGKRTPHEIAYDVGRSKAAVEMQASKMKLSLSTGRRVGRRRERTESPGNRAP